MISSRAQWACASFVEVSPFLLLHLSGQLRIAACAAPDRPFHEIHFPPEVREPGRAGGGVERDDQRQHGERAVGAERRPVRREEDAGVWREVGELRAGDKRRQCEDGDGQPDGDRDGLHLQLHRSIGMCCNFGQRRAW